MIKKIPVLFILFLLANSLTFAEEKNHYVNEEYGVTITGSEGWQKDIIEYNPLKVMQEEFTGKKFDVDKEAEEAFQSMLKDNPTIKLNKDQEEKVKRDIKRGLESIVLVTFDKFGEDESHATIGLAISDVSDLSPSTATLDFVNDEILFSQQLPSGSKIIEQPITIDVNGNKMVRFATVGYDEASQEHIKDISYYYIKNGKLYTLSCLIAYPGEPNQSTLDEYQKAFDKTVNSLIFKDVSIKEESKDKEVEKADNEIPVLIVNAKGDARIFSIIWSLDSKEIAFIRHISAWRPGYSGVETICDKYFIYRFNIETEELKLIDTFVGDRKFDMVKLLLWDKDGNLVYCTRENGTYKPFFYVIDKNGTKREIQQDDKLIKDAGVETKEKLLSKLFSQEGHLLSLDEKKCFVELQSCKNAGMYIIYDPKISVAKNGKKNAYFSSWSETNKKKILENVNWGTPSIEEYKKPKESKIKKSETDIINGKIISKESKKPIENVLVICRAFNYQYNTATDPEGMFVVRYCKGSPYGVELEFFSPDYYYKKLILFEPIKKDLVIELSPKQKDANLPILRGETKNNQGFNFKSGKSTLNSEESDFIVSLTSLGGWNEFRMLGDGGVIPVKGEDVDAHSTLLNMTEAPAEGYLANIKKEDIIYENERGGKYLNFYIRTRDGKHYAKFNIISYGMSSHGESHMSFSYVYQPDGSRNLGTASPSLKKEYENLPYDILLQTN